MRFQSHYCVQSPKGAHKALLGPKPSQLATGALAPIPTSRRRAQRLRKARMIPDTENEGTSDLQEEVCPPTDWILLLPSTGLPPLAIPKSLNSAHPIQCTGWLILGAVEQLTLFCVLDIDLGSPIRF